MIDPHDAEVQGKVLAEAAEACPLRQVRSELNRRAAEWKRAASDAALVGEHVAPAAGVAKRLLDEWTAHREAAEQMEQG